MSSHKATVHQIDDVNRYEGLKLYFLAAMFFCIIGSYTIIRDLKNSIFMGVVGKEYINYVRILTLIGLVPAILFYSKLVDKTRRSYLLIFYSLFYAILLLIFAYFLGHPEIGLANTDQSKWRLFGWIFYFCVEGFSPFVVSVFWAFTNSITNPEEAKRIYGPMVAGSKIGGMITSGISYFVFSTTYAFFGTMLTDTVRHQIILGLASGCLFIVTPLIFFLTRRVPGKYLHGYEAAYQVEKRQEKEGGHKAGLFEGLQLLIKYPYVLGLFVMVFFFELLATVLGYLRLVVVEAASANISQVSSTLLGQMFFMHAMGLVISFWGTGYLLKRLGTRLCLLLIPVLMGSVLIFFIFNNSPFVIGLTITLFKSIHYAFSVPIRESLFIPTIKEIRFKSKSWMDAFGSKFAKTSGSTFNQIAPHLGSIWFMPVYSFFFAGIVTIWFSVAYLLGKRFEKAVQHNEVIGLTDEQKGARA